ncbi:MAG: hypothetical protein ACRD3Q_15420, partial [Terriglobales bacterium]
MRWRGVIAGICCLALSFALAGCGGGKTRHMRPSHSAAVTPAATPQSTPSPTLPCATLGDCPQRFDAAAAFVQRQPGHLGVVVRYRQTGKVWTAGEPGRRIWTASSIKLAIAADMLERDHSVAVTLSSQDRSLMAGMLNWSDEDAAMTLWKKYEGDAGVTRWRTRYGMKDVGFVPGFARNWGFMKATARDFDSLVSYVLSDAIVPIRQYLVSALQGVAANQRWGIWAAGSQEHPGNKDGWSYEADNGGHNWITNTVGFAGPQQRYVLAVMYQLPPGGTLAQGVHTVSDLV